MRRDPISFTTDVNFKFNIRPSQIFPAVLSNQYYLNMGAGRIYFKVFPILTIATSLVAFLICTVYILGMRYWDRQEYRDILKEITVQELPEIVKKMKEEIERKKREAKERLARSRSQQSQQQGVKIGSAVR